MRHLLRLTRKTGIVTGLAIPAFLLTLTTALAHSGHAQGDHGFRVDRILDVAGTAAAIVIVYGLATWFFGYRDRADHHRDQEPRQNLSRWTEPDHGHPPPPGDLRQSR